MGDNETFTGARPAIRRVFGPAAAIIIIFVVLTILFPSTAETVIGHLQENVVSWFSWYYVLLIAGFVVFALWIGLSRFGDIKLGRVSDEPEFSLRAWFSMLFAAGMGIGLVFWGAAEPLSHFVNPRPGVSGTDEVRAEFAMSQTYLHWGLHAWAVYVVIGGALAYSIHRRGRPVSIRWALEPLLGDRVKGRLGDAIDITAIVGTLFGVATSLGLGVLQIGAGLEILGVAESTTSLQVLLIVLVTGAATASVVSGLARGLKWLSNTNMIIAIALLGFVLIAGPTLFLLREFVQSIGEYLFEVVPLTFDVDAFSGDVGIAWLGRWTTFYWGWWISWAPFVGIFIARISRGRTLREFVGGVLIVPTFVTFFWFSVMGGSAIYREMFGDGGLLDDGEVVPEFTLFHLFDGLPLAPVMTVIAIALIAVFFVTSSDSGALVLSMVSRGGDPHPTVRNRVFWAAMAGAVAIALLLAGGLVALQTAAILMALPFSIVMIGICFAAARAFHEEHRAYIEAERQQFRTEVIEALGVRSGTVETDEIVKVARGPRAENRD